MRNLRAGRYRGVYDLLKLLIKLHVNILVYSGSDWDKFHKRMGTPMINNSNDEWGDLK